ncbi:ATP-binding protein [Sphingomonas sp. BK069]|uniref:sensor histidine kinase n=1 Tax=Sphingomonas sp. BK069 TaxID=2586979 RepID=UPI001620C2F4|nr:ATP-binding protein [Sphingomonas sp. BK069]MBB3347195.1 signal transduction histidine kinase [Sphingomonas sp. BK069]
MRRPRPSLLARILWWHAAAVLLTALAASASVYLFLNATADRFERQTLRSEALAVRDQLAARAGGAPAPASPGDRARLEAAGLGYAVLDARGTVVLDRLPAALRPALRIARGDGERYLTRRSRRAFYAALSVPVTLGGERHWIVAVQNLDHPANVVDDVIQQFLAHAALVVLPLLVLLLGVDALIVRSALRPVRRASALVRTVGPARPDVRLAAADLPAEVRPLAEAINDALDRLTESLDTQRAFTADAAHELRTPITLARIRAEQVSDPALGAALKRDLDALGQIVAQLLEIAELDSLALVPHAPVDLAALAEQTVAAIAPLAYRRGYAIALDRPAAPVMVAGHAGFLARALGALVENAVQHTPSGTSVTVEVTSAGDVSVTDDGPGIASHQQDAVFQRFWRRERGAGGGAGLGLAIVARVASIHCGHVELVSRPGRTRFRFAMPRMTEEGPGRFVPPRDIR